MEAQVARGEIELLVVGWIVRDVHLAVFACYAAILLQNDCGVVVQAGSTTLEQRGNDDYAQLFRQVAKEIGGRAWDGLCQVEVIDTLHLTKVQGVVQFLQHDEFSTLLSQFLDFLSQPLAVVSPVAGVVLLYQSYLHNGCKGSVNRTKSQIYFLLFCKRTESERSFSEVQSTYEKVKF